MDESVTDESYQDLFSSLFDESLLNAPILKQTAQTFYYIDTKENFDNNGNNDGNFIGFTEYKSEIEGNIKDNQGVVKVTVKEGANVFTSSKSELTEEEIKDLKKRGYDLVAVTDGDKVEYIVLNDDVIENKEFLTLEESSSNYSQMETEYKEATDAITASMLATLAGSNEDQKKAEAEQKKKRAAYEAQKKELENTLRELGMLGENEHLKDSEVNAAIEKLKKYEAEQKAAFEQGKQDLEERLKSLNILGEDEAIEDEQFQSALETLQNADVNPDPGYLSRAILKINDITSLLESLHSSISGFEIDPSLGITKASIIPPSKEFVNKLINNDGAGNFSGSVIGYSTKLKNFREMLMSMNPDWELYENINALSNLSEFGEAENLTDVELANLSTEYANKITKIIDIKTIRADADREELWVRDGKNKNKKVLLYEPEDRNQYKDIYDFASQAKDYYNSVAFNRVAYESIIEDKSLTDEEKAFYLKNKDNRKYTDIVAEYSHGKFKMLAYDSIINDVALTPEQQAFYDEWTDASVVQEYSVYKYCLIASNLENNPLLVTPAQKAWYDSYSTAFNSYARDLNAGLVTGYNEAIETGQRKANPNCNVAIEYRDNPYMCSSYYVCDIELTNAERTEAAAKLRSDKAKKFGVDESEVTISDDEIPKTKKVDVYNPYSLATDTERFIISTWATNGAKENRATAAKIEEARQLRIDEIGDLVYFNYYRWGQGDASARPYSKELGTKGTESDYAEFIQLYGSQLQVIEDNISFCFENVKHYKSDDPMHDIYMTDIKYLQDNRALWQEKYDLVSPEGSYATEIYNREKNAYRFDLIGQQCQYAAIMQIPEMERTGIQNDFIKVGYPQFVLSYQKFETERLYDLSKWQQASDENALMSDIINKYALSLVTGPVHSASKLDTSSAKYRVSTWIKGSSDEDVTYQNYIKSLKRSANYDAKLDGIANASFDLTIYLHDFKDKAKLRINKVDYKIDGKYRVAVCYDADGNEIEDVDYREIALYYAINGEKLPDRKYAYSTSTLSNGAGSNQSWINHNKGIYLKVKSEGKDEYEYQDVYFKIDDQRTGLLCLDDTELKTEILAYMDTKALETDNFKYFSSNMDYFAEYGKKVEGQKIAAEWLKSDGTSQWKVFWRSLGNGFDQFCHGFSCLFGGAVGYTTPEDYAMGFYTEGLVEQFDSIGELVKGMSEIVTSIGNMGIPMIVGIAGTILEYFCPPAGVALQYLSTALMGLSAGGNAYEQGLKQGMEDWQAILYGCLVGTSEALLERLIGAIPGLSNMEKFAKLPGIGGFVAKMISEGIEESIQEILEPVFAGVLTGKSFGEIINSIDLKNVFKAGLYGMITAGVLNGAGAAINTSLSFAFTNTSFGLNMVLANYTEGRLAGNFEMFKSQLSEVRALAKADPDFKNTRASIANSTSFQQNYREYSESWDAYKNQLEKTYDSIKNDASKSQEANQIKEQLKSMNDTGKLTTERFIEQILIQSIMGKVEAANTNLVENTQLSVTERAYLQQILSYDGDITKISELISAQMISNLKLNTQQLIGTTVVRVLYPAFATGFATGEYVNAAGETISLKNVIDADALVTEVNNMLNTEKITMGEVVAALGGLNIEQINTLIANSSSLAQTEVGKFVTQAMKIYSQGLEYASNKYKSFFENFRDHGFKHSLEVTKYALSKTNGANLSAVQTSLLAFAALSHDFGMQGGQVVFDSKTCKSMAKNCSPDVIESFANQMFSGTELTEFINGFNGIDQSDPAAVQKYLESKISGKAISLDVLQNILTKTKISDSTKLMSEFEFVSSFVRSQHPLNSALDIIENADIVPTEIQGYIEKLLNDNGIIVDSTENLAANVLAILAMTHSKSTSGISMFDVVSQWNDCINKLEVAANERGIKINKSALEAMIKNETVFNELVSYATWIRDGDAMSVVVSPDGKVYTIMQDGGIGILDDSKARVTGSEDSLYIFEDKAAKKTYKLSKDESGQFFYLDSAGNKVTVTDASKIKTLNLYNIDIDGKTYRVNKSPDGSYYYTDADGSTHTISDASKIYAAKYENASMFLNETVEYEDGRPTRTVDNAYSAGIHASELYVSHDSIYTYDSDGKIIKYEASAEVTIAEAMPTIAFHDIVERLGEVNTYTNIADRSFVIKLPAGTDSVTAMMYMQEVASWATQASKEFTTKIDGMLASGKITAEQHAQLLERQMKFYNNIKVDVPGANYSIAYNTGVNACTVVVNADVVAKINAETDMVAKMKALSDAIPDNIRKTASIGSENAKMILGADVVEKINKVNGVVDQYSKTGFDVLTVEQMSKILSDSKFMSDDFTKLNDMLDNAEIFAEAIKNNKKDADSMRGLLKPFESALNSEKIFIERLTDTKSVNKAIEAVSNSSIDIATKNAILNILNDMQDKYKNNDIYSKRLNNYKSQFSSERLKIVADIDLIVEKAYTFAYEFGTKHGLMPSEIPTKADIEAIMRAPKGTKKDAMSYAKQYSKYTAAVKSEFKLGRTLSFDGGRITIASGETAGIKFLSRTAVETNQVGGFVTGGEMLFSSLGEVLQKSGFVITDDIISFEKGLNKIKHAFDITEQQKEANSGTYKAQKYDLSKVSAEELFDTMSRDPETSHLTLDDVRKLRRQYLEEVTKIKEKICSDVISADADYLYDSEVVIFVEQDGKITFSPLTYDEYNAWVDYRYANNILFTAAGLPEHKTIFDSSIDMNGQHYMALPTDASGQSNYYSLSLLEFLAGVIKSNATVLSGTVN